MKRALTALAAALTMALGAGDAVAAVAIDYRGDDDNGAFVKVFDKGGLELRAGCASNGPVGADPGDLTVLVRSSVDNASLHVSSQNSLFIPAADLVGYGEIDDFDAGAGNEQSLGDIQQGFDLAGNAVGQILYSAPNGTVVAIDYLAESTQVPTSKECVLAGVARVLKKGKTRIFFREAAGASKRVLDAGGLRLRATCTGADIAVAARSKRDGAAIHISSRAQDDLDMDDDDEHAYQGVDTFLSGASEEVNVFASGVVDEDAAGQIVYVRGGTVVSVDFMIEDNAVPGSDDCLFAGAAQVARDGDANRPLWATTGAIAGEFFSTDDLALHGTCNSTPDQNIAARATRDDTIAHASSQSDVTEDSTDEHAFLEDNDLDPVPEQMELGPDLPDRNSVGQLMLAYADGRAVSVDYLTDEVDALGAGCVFAGALTAAG